jgi:hypothetical protein
MTEDHTVLANALRSARDAAPNDDGTVEDALRLILAFMRIRDATSRRSIIQIVETIAAGSTGPDNRDA